MADDVKNVEAECALPPSKRKPDSFLVDAEDQPKKSKTEIETPVADGEPLASEVQEEDDDDEDDEHFNGEAEMDRKGKGIVTRGDKGKGKMVEEEEEEDESDQELGGDGDDDDDDSSDEDGDDSGDEDDSDLSDDPLTEVDLDNILPSRTRRRVASNAGICLGKAKDNSGD